MGARVCRTYPFTESHTCATDTGIQQLGPGRGDRIAYLRNVRLVWIDNGAGTSVQVSATNRSSVDELASGVAGLDLATDATLVALDPFGAKAPSPPTPDRVFGTIALQDPRP